MTTAKKAAAKIRAVLQSELGASSRDIGVVSNRNGLYVVVTIKSFAFSRIEVQSLAFAAAESVGTLHPLLPPLPVYTAYKNSLSYSLDRAILPVLEKLSPGPAEVFGVLISKNTSGRFDFKKYGGDIGDSGDLSIISCARMIAVRVLDKKSNTKGTMVDLDTALENGYPLDALASELQKRIENETL